MTAMTPRAAWVLAYRFIRSDAAIPWDECMRPFKSMAIAANKCRDDWGRSRWPAGLIRDNGRSRERRYDLIFQQEE